MFYSVAEHSVLVSKWAETLATPGYKTLAAQTGLMHDASEAYLGDVPKPIKDLLPAYKALEAATERSILRAFLCAYSVGVMRIVKRADLEVLGAESRAFMVNPEWSIIDGYEPADVRPIGVDWRSAKSMFLRRFDELF